MVVVVADTIDEVVDLANDTTYSLTAGVWTKDIHTALDVTSRVRSGQHKLATISHHGLIHSFSSMGQHQWRNFPWRVVDGPRRIRVSTPS